MKYTIVSKSLGSSKWLGECPIEFESNNLPKVSEKLGELVKNENICDGDKDFFIINNHGNDITSLIVAY
jgi:benzoyl-CoA reductase/2-hydroxyglutaryl-CoA dehydratase subunit BcrC/BadD/HgdB